MTKTTYTHGGQYLEHDGRSLVEAAPGTPDIVLCRRVADFPHGRPPTAAAIATCTQCAAPVAFNPAGPHLDRPKLCLQCGGIQPLPFSEGGS